MTICRYFLQGNCRFGERCRFEHTESNYSYDQRNSDNYRERQGYGQSNYYRQGNQFINDRYDVNDYYNDRQRNYSPDRYPDNYRNESKYSSNAYNNQQYNNYKKDYGEYTRYNDANYGRNQQYSNNHRNENTYGQNRFRWLSDDYKKHAQPNVPHENNFINQDYSTSTPKGKVAFSFKVPESEIKKDSGFSQFPIDEQDQLHAERIKEDAKSWELGGLWPFTCYFPYPDKYGFPGFWDISPEELRYAAYKAEENNTYDSYVQSVQNALVQINQQRSQLQIPTPELFTALRKIRQGENACCASKAIVSIPFLLSDGVTSEEMELPAVTTASASSTASFSFKTATETDFSTKPTAASFSFKLPTASEQSSVVPSVSNGDPDVYTPLENLTDEEKKQFTASTFELGKIPTKPPPQVLCT